MSEPSRIRISLCLRGSPGLCDHLKSDSRLADAEAPSNTAVLRENYLWKNSCRRSYLLSESSAADDRANGFR